MPRRTISGDCPNDSKCTSPFILTWYRSAFHLLAPRSLLSSQLFLMNVCARRNNEKTGNFPKMTNPIQSVGHNTEPGRERMGSSLGDRGNVSVNRPRNFLTVLSLVRFGRLQATHAFSIHACHISYSLHTLIMPQSTCVSFGVASRSW